MTGGAGITGGAGTGSGEAVAPTTHYRSPNFDARTRPVSVLVLHYTGMPTAAAALERLCDPAARVSAHYVIEENGAVHALVDEAQRAWHAGAGSWRGIDNVNDVSIGIEIVNPGHEWGYRRFPLVQMRAVAALGRAIVARYRIAPCCVIGHSDSAPLRKTDPGELFDWSWLAREGVGFWFDGVDEEYGDLGPGDSGPLVGSLQRDLVELGYGVDVDGIYGPVSAACIQAFQRHFRPSMVSGIADSETRGRLTRLLRLLAEGIKP